MRSASRVVFGPHDRRAVPFERQNGERPGRQKMLLGAAAMIAFMADSGHDRRLAVVPAVNGDAGALADRRARAVRGDEEPRVQHGSRPLQLRTRRARRSCVDLADSDAARNATPTSLRLRFQRGDQVAVLDHVGERLARLDLAGEGEEDRTHRVAEPAVGDNHVEDRLRSPPPRSAKRPAFRTAAAPPRRCAEARSSSARLRPASGRPP